MHLALHIKMPKRRLPFFGIYNGQHTIDNCFKSPPEQNMWGTLLETLLTIFAKTKSNRYYFEK